MKYFSVPSDFKTETIDSYCELHNKYNDSRVIETYGQITVGNKFESGRSLENLPKIDIIDLGKYVEYSRSKGIEFNYTINAPYMGNREFTSNGIKEILQFLDMIYQVGVRSLTICLPTLIDIVKSSKYDFNIKLSTITQITNANQAKCYKDVGLSRIVVGESINRNFDALKRIRNTYGDKVEIIVNSICHLNCINRMFHYNQASGDSVQVSCEDSINYYPHKCMAKRYDDISSILKLSWVRPEDLKYYKEIGINYFKIQGRQNVLNGNPKKAIEAYFSENFDGNLLELLDIFAPANFRTYIDNKKMNDFIKPFYQKEHFCKNDCDNCNYCKNYALQHIDVDEFNRVSTLVKKFYSEYDKFKNLVDDTCKDDSKSEDSLSIDIDFDF